MESAVSVLLSAVFNEDEESYIFVKDGESWEKRQVEVGINNLQHVEIKSELEVDDVVALSRPKQFRDQDNE